MRLHEAWRRKAAQNPGGDRDASGLEKELGTFMAVLEALAGQAGVFGTMAFE